MPDITFPATDLPPTAAAWTETQKNLYNKLDYYLAKTSVDFFKQQLCWQKMMKPFPWKANQGNVVKGVTKVPSPHVRSEFLPQPISSTPKMDVNQVREISEMAQLYRHYFDSLQFQFLPSFQDFLTDHVDATNKDMVEKIARTQDLFLRTAIFHGAPHVFISGDKNNVELETTVPYWTGYTIAQSKTTNFLKAACLRVNGNLSLKTLAKLATIAEYDVSIPFFSGANLGDGSDGKALNGKYGLLCSTEAWYNFQFDSHLLDNRQINLDVVTDGFTGSLFGRIATKFEQKPLRIAADGTIPVPETMIADPNNPLVGLPVPNPAYVAAPYEVAWLFGAEAYKSISVGPPPSEFAAGGMSMDKFRGMDWSGKVMPTRNFDIAMLDQNNAVVYMPNNRGEYLKLIATAVYGIMPINRRNIIPILFARQRVGANV